MTLRSVCYSLLRAYVTAGLKFYYRKIIIHGKENIPESPVLFTPNHQNAFMDALVIVCFHHKPVYFLTRADIFKSPWAMRVLNFLRMVPIYRIRDGVESLAKNQETFDRCAELFKQGNSIVIFPEGNHGSERRVRPVGKGFTRIVFETLKKYPHLNLSIIPVGLNYSCPGSFLGGVSIYFGKPLTANRYDMESRGSANQLRADVESSLQQLTMHVDDPSRYADVLRHLENSGNDFLDPVTTNQRVNEILKGINPPPASKDRPLHPMQMISRTLSSVINFIPLATWKIIARGIKDPVFTGSLKFAFGIFAFPAFYLLVGLGLFFVFGSTASIVWLALATPSMLFRK